MKKIRLELVYLRAIICAIIIITHLLTQITLKHENLEGGSLVLQFYIRNIVIFGTPCFIILSQLLTTLNYQKVTYRLFNYTRKIYTYSLHINGVVLQL